MKTLDVIKRINVIALTILIYIIIISSCDNKDDIITTAKTIYTAGDTSVDGACYWVNKEERVNLLVLGQTRDGSANDIHVTGNDIYVAGHTINDLIMEPCYWINGVHRNLPVIDPDNNGDAIGIYAVGTAIFTIGYTQNNEVINIPCYWINEERVDLPILDESLGGQAFDMQVVDNIVYTAGYTTVHNDANENGMIDPDEIVDVPCYWIGDTLVILPVPYPDQGGQAHAIYVVENDVYIAGYTKDHYDVNMDEIIDSNEFFDVPCYWKNGIHNSLPVPDPEQHGNAKAIRVMGNTIYTAGYTEIDNLGHLEPCYWIDKTHISLPVMDPGGLFEYGEARDIELTKDTIYTAGRNRDNLGVFKPCYWTNHNELIILPVPDFINGNINAIQVVEE